MIKEKRDSCPDKKKWAGVEGGHSLKVHEDEVALMRKGKTGRRAGIAVRVCDDN